MKRNKLVLTKKKQEQVQRKKPEVIKGKPLHYNAASAERYKRKLDALILQMTRTTQRRMTRLFEHDTGASFFETHPTAAQDATITSQAKILTNELRKKFQQLFDRRALSMAEAMVNDADKTSKAALHESLKALTGGMSIKTSTITAPMKQILKASIAENVSLIKSIPQQYFQQIEGSVMRSITTGNGLQDLVPAMQNYEGITLRRAQLIARDQTKKAYSNLNAGRMAAIGMKKYQWQHSAGDVEPRPLHVQYQGQIFSLDDPPIIQYAKGSLPEVRGKPGDLINCTCIMIPVIEFDTGEDNADE